MVADPTRPATWMVASASKLSLSKADLIDTPFLGGSARRSNADGIVGKARARGGEVGNAVHHMRLHRITIPTSLSLSLCVCVSLSLFAEVLFQPRPARYGGSDDDGDSEAAG